LKNRPGIDESFARVGLGVAVPINDGVNLAIGGQTIAFKKGERETSVGATLRRRF
jgi:hypothetical protein